MIWQHWAHGKRIARLQQGQALTKAELDALFTHLRRCERCRRVYDLAMGTDRLLASKGASASVPSRAVLDGLAARVMPEEAPVKRPMPWLVPALASAVALVLVAVVLVQRPADDELTPRDGDAASFVVKVFCDQPPAAPVALDQTPGNRCPEGSMYRFAYTSQAPCNVEISASVGGNKTLLGPTLAVPESKTLRALGSAIKLNAAIDRIEVSCRNGPGAQVITIQLGTTR